MLTCSILSNRTYSNGPGGVHVYVNYYNIEGGFCATSLLMVWSHDLLSTSFAIDASVFLFRVDPVRLFFSDVNSESPQSHLEIYRGENEVGISNCPFIPTIILFF